MNWEEMTRATRRARLEAAKVTQEHLQLACDDYEEHYDLQAMRVIVDALKSEATQLDDAIKILQKIWREKREEYGKAKTELHEYGVIMALVSKQLKKTIYLDETAWENIPVTLRSSKVQREAVALLKQASNGD